MCIERLRASERQRLVERDRRVRRGGVLHRSRTGLGLERSRVRLARRALALFASEEHRALFAASPARYAPAYGGYCAFAAADGRLARIDPQAWHIEGGRLFLNYSLDIRRQWLEGRAHFIEQADARWPELSRQGADRIVTPPGRVGR